MDDDELFGVFEEKKPAVSYAAADTGAGGKPSEHSAPAGKRKAEGEGAEEEGDADEEEDGKGEPPSKRRLTTGNEVLCPAAGVGSVMIHDITPFNPELGRKAHRHQVAIPPGLAVEDVRKPAGPCTPAKVYNFELDPFQKAAVGCIEKNQSVLVAAHTSAGKTAVAEYAIALALREKQRVVYTSPIKALSNQKFRELSDEFRDVGLMTGDVTINPEASLLVMTTEILRSMLYRGSELLREVVWVIYDEIHYMRDRERGVVWEESIVLVPHKFRFVFLSATIPNAPDFASWVARVHMQPVNVVYTDYRPTPLMHYMFPAGGDGLHLVVDQDGAFKEDNFHKCLAKLETQQANNEIAARKAGGGRGGGGAGGKGGGGKGVAGKKGKDSRGADSFRIIKLIMQMELYPCIAFAFGKRDTETLANSLKSIDFTTDDEKASIETIYNSAMASLSEDDRKLPAVEALVPLLKRGIGIHHGGLLPILKEVTEILFQEGLIKLLCATETFSMGLNMPAKTCIFTGVKKFDGEEMRYLASGEYIQMSGRAGRRGLDSNGICVMMIDEKMDPQKAKGMVMGQADPLNSSFHLGYNMLLNLLRFEGADPEFLIQRSFYQFQEDKKRPEHEERMKTLEEEKDGIVVEEEAAVAEYSNLLVELEHLKEQVRQVSTSAKVIVNFLQPGRLVECTHPTGQDWGWGVVVNFNKGKKKNAYVMDVLLWCKPPKTVITQTGQEIVVGDKQEDHMPPAEGGMKVLQVVQLGLDRLKRTSSVRVFVPADIRSPEARKTIGKTLSEVEKRFVGVVPELDPVEDLEITDEGFKKTLRRIETVENRINQHKVHKSSDLQDALVKYRRRSDIDKEMAIIKKSIKDSTGMAFRSELKGMKRVLRRLGYINTEEVVQTKGTAACEIDTGDELVITELIFDGVFNDLSPEMCAALLSCFVFDEKNETGVQMLSDEVKKPLQTLREKARRVATVAQESKLTIDVEEYVAKFKEGLMDVVVNWCRGHKFADIIKNQDLFEGSVIRVIRRLEELVVQLAGVAKVIGNTDLENKFMAASKMMKRDIVFAASLYL